MWSVSVLAVAGIEPETGDYQENMSFARVNSEPPAGAILSIASEPLRRSRRFQFANGVKNVRNRAGTIVSIVVKRPMPASIPVRFSNELIPGCDSLSHNGRCLRWRAGPRPLHNGRPRRVIVIDIRRRCFAACQNDCQSDNSKEYPLAKHGADSAITIRRLSLKTDREWTHISTQNQPSIIRVNSRRLD